MSGTTIRAGKPWQDLLREGLAALDIPATDTVIDGISVRGSSSLESRLSRYMDELELFNRVFDLVGAESREGLVVRHILDSLSPWKHLVPLLSGISAPCIADAGTGAGLPGIPLSLLFPEIPITLIERMSRRCSFLENFCALLSLHNATVLESPVEQAPQGGFSLVVFRAFRPLDAKMYRSLDRLLADGGHLAAWKGKMDKIDEEMSTIAGIVGDWRVFPSPVPFLDEHERHLVAIHHSGT